MRGWVYNRPPFSEEKLEFSVEQPYRQANTSITCTTAAVTCTN